MKKLLVAVLLSFVALSLHAQSCPNIGTTYAKLENIRFSDQFSGTYVPDRILAAAADLKACSTRGLIVIPSHEPNTANDGIPACTGSNMLGVTLLDLRGQENGGAAYSLCADDAPGYFTMQVAARRIVVDEEDKRNAIAILGSALTGSGNRSTPGGDDLGEGENVVGVWGEVASAASAGVYGINYGSEDGNGNGVGGPGVQGDTINLPGSIGVLGVADAGGTSGNPNRAVEGRAVASNALAGFFDSNQENVVKVYSSHTYGGGLLLTSKTGTSTSRSWRLLSGGATAPIGVDRFSILNQDDNRHPFHISPDAPSHTLHLEQGGVAIGDQGTPIKKSFSSSTSWTPGTVNDNATTSGTFTVNNAALGDPCFAGFTGITTSGYLLSCSVTGANSVTVMLLNKTGSQQTLGAGTLRATVFQY